MARWADGSEAVRILLSAGTLAPRWAPLCCLPQAASSSTPFVIPQYSTPCPGCQREIPGTEAGQGGTILREQLQKAPDAQKAVYQGEHDQNGVDHAVQLRVLFSAMVEAALLKFTGQCDMESIVYAISKHKQWYKGDGTYGDGEHFHNDYYNSFVIQPMLLDVLAVLREKGLDKDAFYDTELIRFIRYAEQQERLISPEGTFPPIGRSLAYRFGAFQVLSQTALMKQLPAYIVPAQVRSALTTVIERQISQEGTFDNDGWLQLGFCGHQPEVAETYISTGSLYLCSAVFLPLGLPATDEFWTGDYTEWTAAKAWSGKKIRIDGALKK